MNIIVPTTIRMVEMIIAADTNKKSLARLSGSSTSLNNSFNGSTLMVIYLTKNMYWVVVGSILRSFFKSAL
jgi:hypothetical protein